MWSSCAHHTMAFLIGERNEGAARPNMQPSKIQFSNGCCFRRETTEVYFQYPQYRGSSIYTWAPYLLGMRYHLPERSKEPKEEVSIALEFFQKVGVARNAQPLPRGLTRTWGCEPHCVLGSSQPCTGNSNSIRGREVFILGDVDKPTAGSMPSA